jgi:methylglutaconyl-CoA hydratase
MTAVHYEVFAGVATLTMDQPHNGNALSAALVNGLGDGISRAVADPYTRVVVLTHSGPAFCAGADLSGKPATEEPRYQLTDILSAIADSPKPVVARIAGHCLGGGVGLAAGCDLSIASTDAKFGFTEVRIGVAPAMISVVCLPKLRRADAIELFLTGERISADRAADAGLINSAVPVEQLDAAVADLVTKLNGGGPNAMAACKQLIALVPTMSRAKAFEYTAKRSRELFASPEASEGMAAFREKRKASWVPE